MKILAFLILISVIFLLTGYIKKSRSIKKIGINIGALIGIYIAAAIFGPAKYTVDLDQSPLVVNQKKYILVWELNRLLPFESLVVPKALIHNANNSGIDQYAPLPSRVQDSLTNSYQPEVFFKQYFLYILLIVWLYFNLRDESLLKPKIKITPQMIDEAKGIEDINRYIDHLKGRKGRKILELARARREALKKELSLSFYFIAKGMHTSANKEQQSSHLAQLPLWIAQQMLQGRYDFSLDISLTTENDFPRLKKFSEVSSDAENSHSIFCWYENRSREDIEQSINKLLRDSLIKTLNGILPSGVVTFSDNAQTKINLDLLLVDRWHNSEYAYNIFDVSVSPEKSANFISPTCIMSLSMGNRQLKNQILSRPTTVEIYRDLGGEPKIPNVPKSPNIDTPPELFYQLSDFRTVLSIIRHLVMPTTNAGSLSKNSVNQSADELYDEIRTYLADETKTAIVDEVSMQVTELAIETLIAKNPALVRGAYASVCGIFGTLGISQDLMDALAIDATTSLISTVIDLSMEHA